MNEDIRKEVKALEDMWGDGFAWGVIEALGQGVTILDENGRFAYVNSAYSQMVGRSRQELQQLNPLDITHPDDREQIQLVRQQRLSGESSTYETRLVRPDGTIVQAHVSGVPHKRDGKVIGAFTIVTDLTRFKLDEASLQQSRVLLAGIIASAMDAIISVNEEQNIVLFNVAAEEMFGCTANEAIGIPLDRFIPERFRSIHRQHIQHFGETGITNRKMGHLDTLWAVRASGQEFPIEASISQVTVGGEKLYTVILRDITERKLHEQALRESEARYRNALDNMMEGCQIIGFDWRYRYINDAAAGHGKQSRAALLGRTMVEVYPGIEKTALFAALKECMTQRTAVNIQNEFTYPDGSTGWFDLSIQPVPEGIFILSYDITERKLAEEALRQSKTELQHIIDTVPEGVLLLDAAGLVRLANPLANEYLTVLAPDRTDGRLNALGQRPLLEFLTSPPTKGLWHEIVLDEYVFELIARPVEIGPRNSGWVLVIHDVTQERDIQLRVQRQERLAAVGQMAAGIAHDFNNIMAVIMLYAQILYRTETLSAAAQERLNTVEQQAKRAIDLIQQILDFSRQSVLERKPLNLLPLIKELIKLFDRILPEHVQIDLEFEDNDYTILADVSRIQQVLMNLAVNARDAMPQGGQLQFRLMHLRLKTGQPLLLGELPRGDWIQLQVSDQGSGISEVDMAFIFEPFFTTKEVGRGTGLGLAQVYGIVQQHGGFIDVVSEVDDGTTFTLYFPRLASHEEASLSFDDSLLQSGQEETVLVVEDDAATRRALVDSLTLLNYQVIEAANGRIALSLLGDRAHEIDLVLSDAVMPEIGGVALLYAARQQGHSMPFVLLTGHPLSKEMQNIQTTGFAGWLSKPPDLVTLSQLIAEAIANKPQ